MTSQAQKFWEEKYKDKLKLSPKLFPESSEDKMLVNLLGNVAGKEILEIGCGNGYISLYLAKNGAKVTAIDFSQNSVENTLNLAKNHELEIEAYQLNALDLRKLNKKFDIVVGKFILHHIEPFEEFSLCLSASLKKGGRGIFLENNSRNPILIIARNNLVGKFGIPKYGDDEEYPFEPREIELLKHNVGKVNLYYPNFVFFKKINTYIFKNKQKFKLFMNMFKGMDDFIKNHLPIFHKYSYTQVLEILKQ